MKVSTVLKRTLGKSGIKAGALCAMLAAGFVSVFSVSGCQKQKTTTEAEAKKPSLGSFNVPISGATCEAPLLLAYLNGYYADEGLDVTLVSGNAQETNRSFLAAGKMAVMTGLYEYFPAIYNGIDINLIGSSHEGCLQIIVPKDSSIKSFADFKGKRIAVDEIGGDGMVVASIAAGSVGLDPQNEISWVLFPVDQVIQALDKGEADIAVVWDPFGTKAKDSGKYNVLLDNGTDPLFKGRVCCFIFASGKIIRENPKVVAAFLRALNRAREFIGKNPEESVKIMLESGKIPSTDQDLLVRLVKSYNFGTRLADSDNILAKEDALYFSNWLTKIGFLPKDLNVEQFVDNTYVDIFALEKNRP